MTTTPYSGRSDGRSSLILSRRAGEGIWIGPDVRVTYVPSGSSPRIAIEAPRDMPILRSTLLPGSSEGREGMVARTDEAATGTPRYTGEPGCLVLAMRPGVSAVIGRPGLDYEVSVQRVVRSTARIAVIAPPEVKILRDELADEFDAA